MAHVLIVDDDEDIRLAIRWALEDDGHRVTEAPDGRAALRILRASAEPLVALVDHRMPQITGLELIRLICLDDALVRRHAFVLITASPGVVAGDVRALAPLIAIDLIAKPFPLEEILVVVAHAAQRLDTIEPPA